MVGRRAAPRRSSSSLLAAAAAEAAASIDASSFVCLLRTRSVPPCVPPRGEASRLALHEVSATCPSGPSCRPPRWWSQDDFMGAWDAALEESSSVAQSVDGNADASGSHRSVRPLGSVQLQEMLRREGAQLTRPRPEHARATPCEAAALSVGMPHTAHRGASAPTSSMGMENPLRGPLGSGTTGQHHSRASDRVVTGRSSRLQSPSLAVPAGLTRAFRLRAGPVPPAPHAQGCWRASRWSWPRAGRLGLAGRR